MFQGLRVSLTLWYCVVLGAALVLFGVALYLGVQYSLLTPIENDAAAHAHVHVGQWLSAIIRKYYRTSVCVSQQ